MKTLKSEFISRNRYATYLFLELLLHSLFYVFFLQLGPDASSFYDSLLAAADIGMQKLRHALKVLSETEKQLRSSKNQATWLTVALLQLSAVESSPLTEINSSHACTEMTYLRGNYVRGTAILFY